MPAGQPFSVWSAASSSGEEAYSTAMLLSEQLTHAPWQIIGTDLSTAMVESARRGLYPMDRARMVPPAYLKRFCLKGQGDQTGQVLMARELRATVRFDQANLMQPMPDWLPQFDVIFLRNVLIYFDSDAKTEIVRRVLPEAFVCASSEVVNTIREYERFSTAAMNAYIGPRTARYLDNLKRRLREAGIQLSDRRIVKSQRLIAAAALHDFALIAGRALVPWFGSMFP